MTPGQALDILRQLAGPPPELTKEASFLYRLTAEARTEQALGRPFTKLAQSMDCDPWALASEVVGNLPRMKLSASSAGERRLVRFYELWASNLEKRAAPMFLRQLGSVLRHPNMPTGLAAKLPKVRGAYHSGAQGFAAASRPAAQVAGAAPTAARATGLTRSQKVLGAAGLIGLGGVGGYQLMKPKPAPVYGDQQ